MSDKDTEIKGEVGLGQTSDTGSSPATKAGSKKQQALPQAKVEAESIIKDLQSQLAEKERHNLALASRLQDEKAQRLQDEKARSFPARRTRFNEGNSPNESFAPTTDPATPWAVGDSKTPSADVNSAFPADLTPIPRQQEGAAQTRPYPVADKDESATQQLPHREGSSDDRPWQDMSVDLLQKLRDYFYHDIKEEVYEECYKEAYEEAYNDAVKSLRAQFELKIEDAQREFERKARDGEPSSAADRRAKDIDKIANYTDRMVARGSLHQEVAEFKLLEQRTVASLTGSGTSQVPRRGTVLLAQVQAAIEGQQSLERRGSLDNSSKSYPARKLAHPTIRGEVNFTQVKSILSKAMMHDAQPHASMTKPFTYFSLDAREDLLKSYNHTIAQADLCRQLQIETYTGEMTAEMADFLEHPSSVDFFTIALTPQDTYAYEKMVLKAFDQIQKDCNFSWDTIAQGRPEDCTKVLEVLLKLIDILKDIIDVYPQYGPDKVNGKRVQNSISISVKGDHKAGYRGLWGLLLQGVGFDSHPETHESERSGNRRPQDATLRQTIENYLVKTKGTETSAQSEDLAFQIGRLKSLIKSWLVKRRSNSVMDDKLYRAVVSKGRRATPQRERTDTDGTQWRGEGTSYQARSSSRGGRDSSSRSGTPAHDNSHSSREQYRHQHEEERRRLRVLVQTHDRVMGLDSHFSEEEVIPSDEEEAERAAQFAVVPYEGKEEPPSDERASWAHPPQWNGDEGHSREQESLSHFPQQEERRSRRRDLANLRPGSSDNRGDMRQQQSGRMPEARRQDRPRENHDRDMPRYDNRHAQNPDARLENTRARTPIRQDRASYLKGQACDNFMVGKCPYSESACNYSHDSAICKAKFDAMRRHMESTSIPPSTLKHAATGPGTPHTAQQAVSAMWAEVDERLRRVELAALAPRQQQQRQQPIQLSAAQRGAEGMRSAAYSDDEYEGSLGDASDYSSGTEA